MATRRRVLWTLIAAVAATSCFNEQYGELVGTYDVTTTLETFTFEIPGTTPGVDCPAGNSYCSRTEPAKGATLTALMIIGSGGEKTELGSRVFNASGDGTGSWCAAIDATNGCTGLAPSSVHYGGTFLDATDVRVYIQLEQSPGYGYRLGLNSAGLQGDSLVGTAQWLMPTGYDHKSYSGTFVARKRK